MEKTPSSRRAFWEAIGYAWQFGFTIVVPLVLFGIGGRLLDRKFGTSPWLFLGGILLSIAISSIALTLRVLRIYRTLESKPSDEPRKDISDQEPKP